MKYSIAALWTSWNFVLAAAWFFMYVGDPITTYQVALYLCLIGAGWLAASAVLHVLKK